MMVNFNKAIAHYRPLLKFLMIKAIIGLNTAQGTVLEWFPLYHIPVDTADGWTRPVGDYLVTTLVACEQCLLSIMIWFCFTHKDFHRGYNSQGRADFFKQLGTILKEQIVDRWAEYTRNDDNDLNIDNTNIGDKTESLIEQSPSFCTTYKHQDSGKVALIHQGKGQDDDVKIVIRKTLRLEKAPSLGLKDRPNLRDDMGLLQNDDEVKIRIKSADDIQKPEELDLNS